MAASLLIIGTGLAGYSLAREFRKLNGGASLELISQDSAYFYSKPVLSNALANGKEPYQIPIKTAEQMADELKADIHKQTIVNAIEPEKNQIVLETDKTIEFERLVIAWGATPIRLPIEGDGAEDILSVNNLEDYRVFYEKLAKAKSVVIIGAGLIGCEFANDLALNQKKVSLIDPGAWPISRLMPQEAGSYYSHALSEKGIDFHLGTSVAKVSKTNHTYLLQLKNGVEIKADLILSAVGLKPLTDKAQAAGLICNRGIITNSLLETNYPNIYAMGDCAEVSGQHLPYIMPIMHQARALAKTLTGNKAEVRYPVMPVVVKTPSCPTIVCPPPINMEGNWQSNEIEEGFEAKFFDVNENLRGFSLFGKACAQSLKLAEQISQQNVKI